MLSRLFRFILSFYTVMSPFRALLRVFCDAVSNQTTESQMIGKMMNYELKRISNELAMD